MNFVLFAVRINHPYNDDPYTKIIALHPDSLNNQLASVKCNFLGDNALNEGYFVESVNRVLLTNESIWTDSEQEHNEAIDSLKKANLF
jgi:hypothetical protein